MLPRYVPSPMKHSSFIFSLVITHNIPSMVICNICDFFDTKVLRSYVLYDKNNHFGL
jgi:hypothetical protein